MASTQKVSRRNVLKAAAAVGVSAASTRLLAQEGKDSPATAPASPGESFYYVDGYHGGVDGHMPPTSLQNVLDGLDKFPHWKVSFEIEPYSWAVFAKSDPKSIERLKQFLSDATPNGRIELVSGAYGQAYMWNASGECNIRQIQYGLAELRAIFPDVVVDTYAVQEPCWTSCLPQILKSFGYRQAVLKNSTCWGGYHAPTLDADTIHWVGPDGTAITAIPRYASEDLLPPASEMGEKPTTSYIEKCKDAGIQRPSGTILQDMGWPGHPWRAGISPEVAKALRDVTWREYAQTIAPAPSQQWKASQEDLRVGLPWGGSILQRIAQVVRLSENRLVQAEKIASMALVRRGKPFPFDDLSQPWKDLLWSQHHDVWIVSNGRHKDGSWATAVDAKSESIGRISAQIVKDSASAMAVAGTSKVDAASSGHVRVFNTTGFRRRDLASVEVENGKTYRVLDTAGQEVPSQVLAGANAASDTLVFPAEVPGLGYTTYEISDSKPDLAGSKRGPATATKTGGRIVLETDLYSIAIDPAKGGSIRSLLAKDANRQFVDEGSLRSFNEFRGYLPTESKWISSTEVPAAVSVVEPGPLRVAVEVCGHIGPWPFTTRVSAAAGQRRIDFQTTFEFTVDPPGAGRGRRQGGAIQPQRFRLGEPWEAQKDTVRSNRRPFYDSTYKLQALFPAKLRQPTLDKNGPFDVCRATNSDTRFNTWDGIKNNVIFNWVDLLDQDGSAGLAVFSDHLTAYHLAPGEPLGLVMCYAGRGIWHDYGLGRVPHVSYSIVPHAGDWAKAQLWQELARWGEPLVTHHGNAPAEDDAGWSLMDVSNTGFEAAAAFSDGGHLNVRLFNAEGDAAPKRLTMDPRIRQVSLVELDGRAISDLAVERAADGMSAVILAMPRFAVRTLRCELA